MLAVAVVVHTLQEHLGQVDRVVVEMRLEEEHQLMELLTLEVGVEQMVVLQLMFLVVPAVRE
jgi:hypothetical protein